MINKQTLFCFIISQTKDNSTKFKFKFSYRIIHRFCDGAAIANQNDISCDDLLLINKPSPSH